MMPKRKPNRLSEYDYRTPGAYFVTICTKERKNMFWTNVGASIARPQDVVLSPYGRIAEKAILNIPSHYPAVSVDNYTIMPNHIHLLLQIQPDTHSPTISTIIQQMKGHITKQIGHSIW